MNTYIPLGHLPLESRMCFTLYGLLPPSNNKEYKHTKDPLAWVSLRLFSTRRLVGVVWGVVLNIISSCRELVNGTHMLGMWRDDSPADPLNTSANNIKNRKSIALEVREGEERERVTESGREREDGERVFVFIFFL